ncbi:MAG: hypothetical protein ABSE16_13775 [Verrucomicrobiota bacterium]|jgi:hypothetical protein
MNELGLKQKVSPVVLVDATSRTPTLVFVHEFSQTPVAEELHPCAYLHYAPTYEQWKSDYESAVQAGRSKAHLQRLEGVLRRIETKTNDLRPQYEEQKEHYRAAFARFAILKMRPIDVIVCFPSDRAEARFYHEVIANAVRVNNSNAVDLTPFFKKEPHFKVGKAVSGKKVTVKEAFQKIKCAYSGCLSGVCNVLLIDDTWATGTTAGAIVSHLYVKGLTADTIITVFAPLIVPQSQA